MGISMTVPMMGIFWTTLRTPTQKVATQKGNGTVFMEIENGTVNIYNLLVKICRGVGGLGIIQLVT
jgi:hypothetical protein